MGTVFGDNEEGEEKMKGKEKEYQKCFNRVTIDHWETDIRGGLPNSVAVYFSWNKKVNEFRWKPKWIEIQDIIKNLIILCGKEEVEKELGIKIK